MPVWAPPAAYDSGEHRKRVPKGLMLVPPGTNLAVQSLKAKVSHRRPELVHVDLEVAIFIP